MTVKRLSHIIIALLLLVAQPSLLDFTHAHDLPFTGWPGSEELHSHDCGATELHKPLSYAHTCLACARVAPAGEAAVSAAPHHFVDPTLLVSIGLNHFYRSSDAELILFRGPPAFSS